MTVAAAQILTAETVPAYLKERWDDLCKKISPNGGDGGDPLCLEGVQVKAIQGGNVNFAFCVTFPNGKTIFLKQAPEFVAIFGPDGFPLTSERMQRELDVYQEWKALLGKDNLDEKYLPTIYHFDKSYMVIVMEFLDGYDLLDHVLVDHAGDYNADAASCLGEFMGKTHAQTHSSKVSPERRDYLTKHFENREMRDIQLEFVFSKCYKEATDDQRAGLTLTPEFMKEVEMLKQQYDGKTESLALTHGDLHPGSVMVHPDGRIKVIDPEFTVYGPPGLDVGSLLSGYCLGVIHQAFSNNPQAVQRIVDGARAIWESYSKAMSDGGIPQDLLKEIEIESVGFTVAEVCRTALEFAGGRKWLQFEDAETKATAKKAALQVVDKCMIGRHEGGMELLLGQMKAVSSLQ